MTPNPPRVWSMLMAEEPPRRPQTEDEKARYRGFCAPDGTVRAHDREAFKNANSVEASWRYR